MAPLLLLALLALARPAAGQATLDVPVADPVYEALEMLAGAGLVDTVLVGQRPYSRREVARLVAEAERSLGGAGADTAAAAIGGAGRPYLLRLVERLAAEYGRAGDPPGGVRLAPVETVELELLAAESPPRAFPVNAHARIDAVTNPLLDARGGRRVGEGGNLAVETLHSLRIGGRLVVHARPRLLRAGGGDGRGEMERVTLQELAARLTVGSVNVDVGRQHLVWGQAAEAGLLFSTNAPGLDMLRLSTDRPVVLPGLLRRLGPVRYTFVFADLGPEQHFPGTNVVAHKLSLLPAPGLELGFGLLNQWGGEGAPEAALWERLADNLPLFLDSYLPGLEFQASNKLTQAELRWRLPRAGGTQLTFELALDDFDLRRPGSMLWHDGGYVVGLTTPLLRPAGGAKIGVELHHTGVRFYEHSQFLTGVTKDRFILGNPLGPNADGVYLDASWDTGARHRLALRGAWEARDGDVYRFIPEPDPGLPRGFVRVTDRPTEVRRRLVGSWTLRPASLPLRVEAELGVERTGNFDFEEGEARTGYLGRLGLLYHF